MKPYILNEKGFVIHDDSSLPDVGDEVEFVFSKASLYFGQRGVITKRYPIYGNQDLGGEYAVNINWDDLDSNSTGWVIGCFIKTRMTAPLQDERDYLSALTMGSSNA